MRSVALVLTLLSIACSSSTEPGTAGDPSLLFTNTLDNSYVYVTWRDGQEIFGRDSVAPHTANQCIRFLAQPDSAYWEVTVTEDAQTSAQSYDWFNPADRPAWNVVVSHNTNGSPSIITTETDNPC